LAAYSPEQLLCWNPEINQQPDLVQEQDSTPQDQHHVTATAHQLQHTTAPVVTDNTKILSEQKIFIYVTSTLPTNPNR